MTALKQLLVNPKQTKIENVECNKQLIAKLQPQGNIKLSDERYIKTGDGYCSCVQIYDYPTSGYDFWLTDIIDRDGVIAMLDVGTEDQKEAVKLMGNSLTELNNRYADSKNNTGMGIEAQQKHELLYDMLNEVKTQGEIIKTINCRLYINGRTKEEVDKKVADVISDLETRDYNSAVYLNETEYQYKALFAPYSQQIKWKNKRVGNPIPALSLAGGYPFGHEQIDDEYGMYIAKSATGGNIIFDMYKKTEKRLSYDGFIVGKKGSGKSTLLKMLLTNNAIVGNYSRVIDVTGEFTTIVEELGGTVVTLDGKNGIINCLEVFKTDENEEMSFARHLSKMNTFYKFLSPQATEDICKEFEKIVRELYDVKALWNEKSAENNTQITGLDPTCYPTFTELLDLIREHLYTDYRQKKLNNDLSPSRQMRLESIELTIENLVKNYGRMFDGYTSIEKMTSRKIIAYNVQNVASMKDELFNAMLFNVLSLMLDDMVSIGTPSKFKFENGVPIHMIDKLQLIIDESHKIISTRNELALDYMLDIVREGRKYFTGLITATQSVRDAAPENSLSTAVEKLKTLFEMTQYKFIMQQDNNALVLMRKIFEGSFTDSQLNAIPNLGVGEAIFSTTENNYKIKVDVSQRELELFKGGA